MYVTIHVHKCVVTRLKLKHFAWGYLACLGQWLHTALDKLNSTWYRFSLYCLAEISRWPNQTTGELLPATYVGGSIKQYVPRRETWV